MVIPNIEIILFLNDFFRYYHCFIFYIISTGKPRFQLKICDLKVYLKTGYLFNGSLGYL